MGLRDSLIYIAGKVLPSGLTFATSIVLTWFLIPAEYGLYGLGQAIILLGASVCFEWLLISYSQRRRAARGCEPRISPYCAREVDAEV